jgi:NTE family protein
MTLTAIVLSGGASRGSFEVGALRFIYENPQGIRPDIICGTSVGAINGVKLAEGGNKPSEGWTAFLGLENIWLGLQKNDDMYLSLPWLSTLDDAQKRLFGITSGGALSSAALGFMLKVFLFPPAAIIDAINAGIDIKKIKDAADAALVAKALFTLKPLRDKFDSGLLDISKVQSSGIKLRFAAVSLDSGKLRYITESGNLIERDGKTAVSPTPIPLIDGVMASASEPVVFEPVQLLNETYVDGGCREILPIQAALDLGADTVYAIATSTDGVPPGVNYAAATLKEIALRFIDIITDEIVFKAKNSVEEYNKLTTEWNTMISKYNKLTTEWNIAHLPPGGAATALRVGGPGMTGPAGPGPTGPSTATLSPAPLSLENPKPAPIVKTIRPSLYVHDGMTIDPGLIRINIAYGYMRAADVIQKNEDRTIAEYSDTITVKRVDCWAFEEVMFDTSKPISGVAFGYLPTLRERKKEIRDFVLKRWQAGATVPVLAERWWMNWEAHKFSPTTINPWVAYPKPDGSIAVPAEQQPLGMLLLHNTTNALYLIYGGAKFPVTMVQLNAMGYSAPVASDPPSGIIDNLPTISVDGTLLREFSNGLAIYLIEGGKKRLIATTFWISQAMAGIPGFSNPFSGSPRLSLGDIGLVPDGSLSAIPDGSPLG